MADFKLLAGAGKAEISFSQADFPLKAFTGIHDELFVRVLILETNVRMALVSVELTSLPPEAIKRFQQECSAVTGIEEKNVFVSVTHTFSAPHIPPQIKTEQEQKLSDTMYDRICAAIRRACEEAKASVAETAAEYCEVSCCLNVNRNIATPEGYWIGQNEEGFSDHTVRVLRLRRGEELFAYLINYDIQSSVMDKSEAASGGRLISGDLAGAALRELEKDQPVTAVFLPGCAGDQAPIIQAVQTAEDGTVKDLHENGFVLTEQLGQYLAGRVRAARKIADIEISDRTSENIPGILFDTAVLPEQEMKYPTKELRPHRQFSFDLTGKSIPVPVTVICLGNMQILMTTPELNSGFGAKIRKIMGDHLMIGTLVNGGVKYLPEPEDFERITYEAMNSMLGPGSAEKFLATVFNLKKTEV